VRRDEPLPPCTRGALQRLGRYFRDGRILVTTTRRLLNYERAIRQVSIDCRPGEHGLQIDLTRATGTSSTHDCLERGHLDGLTFYVPGGRIAGITLDNRPLSEYQLNGPDHTGRTCISLCWTPLTFPD
jgi:hypothetical protein